jgi:L,D-peptidoglycan transpeptidase YkuD (ErfK/YbiS/YcfS/YnhG family)
VLVLTEDWDAPQGSLRSYERDAAGRWRATRDATPVTVGRNGVAWGLGRHPAQPGPQKREGDGRAPAGAFALGTAFGYGEHATTAMPYAAMQASDWCIDVVDSPLYNRLVDSTEVGAAAVEGSTEPMRRDLHADGDQRYKLGFVIEHNPDARAAQGSCIFAHLWKAPGQATAGCTAMDEAAMQALLAWLDPARTPRFVLLPRSEYARLRDVWHLPSFDDETP